MRAYVYNGSIRLFDAGEFKAARERKLWTLEEVATVSGVSRTAVYNWEHGRAEPHPSRIETLALHLGEDFLRRP